SQPGAPLRGVPSSAADDKTNDNAASTPIAASSSSPGQPVADPAPPARAPAELICQAQDQIAALAEMAAGQRRLRAMRRKNSACRKKLETAQREIGTARHNWNEVLSRLGLPETLSIDEALAAWQLLVDAAERLTAWKQAGHELQTLSGIWEDYRQRIVELAE